MLSGWRATVVLLAAATLQGMVARGLWTLRNWARLLVILVLAVNMLGDVVVLVLYAMVWPDWMIAFAAVVKCALSALVIRYLASSGVRQAFGV